MSEIKVKVGGLDLNWKSIPRGANGNAHVEVKSSALEVRWKRDADGIWIETPRGVFGYDIAGRKNDDGNLVYEISQRNSAQQWDGISILSAGEQEATLSQSQSKKGVRVRAQMPGKIIRVLVKKDDTVEKNEPLLVMEAMKMENEIRAPQSGKVSNLKVSEGQAVETGADLLVIDPS